MINTLTNDQPRVITQVPVPPTSQLVVQAAEEAKTSAETARDAAATSESNANTYKNDAQTAKTAAESARDAAATSESNANTYKNDAQTAKTAAESARDAAATSESNANTYKNDAETAKTAAETAKTIAEAALAAGEIYSTTALGIAATTNEQYFWIPSSKNYSALSLYKNNLGVAVYAGKSIIDGSVIDFSKAYRSCLSTSVDPVAFEFVDSLGKRGVSILEDGSLFLKTITMKMGTNDHRPATYIFDIAGKDGKRVIAVDSNGLVFLKLNKKALDILKSQLLLSNPTIENITMSSLSGGYRTQGYVFDIGDESGNRLFAVDNKGSIFLKLNQKALALLSVQLGIYAPSLWRGPVAAEDITVSDKLMTAKIEDTVASPNWYGDIRMPRSGSTVQAIGVGSSRLQLYEYIGQSNSQASGTDTAILTTARFPYHALKFLVGSFSDGSSAIDINTLNDIGVTQDFSLPYPHVAASFSSQYRSRLIGETPDPILCRTDGKGGAPLSDFLKTASPAYCYNNAMTTITAARTIAKSYGMDLDVNIVFVQGENSGSGGTGTSVATYQGWLSILLNNYVTDIKANISRVPKIIIWQTNGLTNGTNDQRNGALAHLAETILRRGTSCVLAGPMYQCPISDTIHGTSIARMMQGEITDLVIREIKANGTWTPLDLDRNPDGTARIARVGNTITGKFNRPVLLDADWIPTVGSNYGFQYTGTTISSVSITNGSADFTITLASSVGGTLSYATRNCDSSYLRTGGASGTNWSAPRGMIYANSGIESIWYQLGYTIPRFIRHYLVRFEETIF